MSNSCYLFTALAKSKTKPSKTKIIFISYRFVVSNLYTSTVEFVADVTADVRACVCVHGRLLVL